MLISIEHLKHHDDDRMEHLIRIGIESDFYELPRLLMVSDGGIDLPMHIRNLLIFKSFDLTKGDLDGSDIAQRPIYDATPWIETQFLAAETEILLAELRSHVTPGLTINWAHCSAFLKIPYPFERGTSHD